MRLRRRKTAITEWLLCSIAHLLDSSEHIYRKVDFVMVRRALSAPAMRASISLLL